MTGDTAKWPRWVRCPGCGQPALYAAENAARPFCSQRCRGADLGAWASEGYRVASESPPDGDDAEWLSRASH